MQNVSLQPKRFVICCYEPLTPGFSNSWLVEPNDFTNFVPLGTWLSCVASNFLAIQTQIRDLNGILLYYSAHFRLENNFRVARGVVQGELSRCFSSNSLWARVSIYFWNSMIPTQVQHEKLSSVVPWHCSFPGSRSLETAEGAKPNWLRVLLNIRKTRIWSLQLHFIRYIHINRPNPKWIQTWTFHLVSLCDENVSHFVTQTRNSLKDLYYISS